MSKFILLLKGKSDWAGMSAAEMESAYKDYSSWARKLHEENKLIEADELANTGKVISGRQEPVISDGPFAESKEAVGGYFLITASSLDEAVEIACACPHLRFGGTVEVRPTVEGTAEAAAAAKAAGASV
jgi:hypothetical protein